MQTHFFSPSFSLRIQSILTSHVLPLGLVVLLAGLPWLPERSLYHRFYYALICAPALVLLALRPRQARGLLSEPIFLTLLAYIAWIWCSIGWTSANEDAASLFKWPLYVLVLFLAFFQLQQQRPDRLFAALRLAGSLVLASTLYALVTGLAHHSPNERLIGTGALSNPLLSSHLFGFFTVYWIVGTLHAGAPRQMQLRALAALVMLSAVIATGSRTPLVALTLAALWLCLLWPGRRSVALTAGAAVLALIALLLTPESFVERGLSYRPDIWRQSLRLIAEHPWIGHGYDSPIAITVQTLGMTFREPHNFALGVLHDVGLLGFALWVTLQGLTLWTGWRHRHDWRFVLASAWMVYGIGAGLTEGGGILSRPKEHWFLLWIPLATMAALSAAKRVRHTPIAMTPLDRQAFARMCEGATVIEQDGLGPKVLKLTDGSFLKIFRRKQWLSSASIDPYGRRFARHSQALAERGLDSPQVLDTFRLHDHATAVRYCPLPGQTLRQALQEAPDVATRRCLIKNLGRLLGQMHERGVYFRSLHLGNVLVLPDQRLALIDIADMRLFDRPLSQGMRQRNLKHMQRYAQDCYWLFEEQRDAFRDGYASDSSVGAARALLSQS